MNDKHADSHHSYPLHLTFSQVLEICKGNDITLTAHATTRAAQRNFAYDDINFIVKYGRTMRRTGIVFCQMLQKCVPEVIPANHSYRRLVGATVVTCQCQRWVITLYRNERAFKADAAKAKYRLYGDDHCEHCNSTVIH